MGGARVELFFGGVNMDEIDELPRGKILLG